MALFSVIWRSILFAGNLRVLKFGTKNCFFDPVIYGILLLNFLFLCVLYFLSFFHSSFKFTDRDRARERERWSERARERGWEGRSHFWWRIYIWIPPSRHRSIPCRQRRYQPVDTTIHILLAYLTRMLVVIQKTWLNIAVFF